MSLSENVRPLLATRAAADLGAARLLEVFTRADEILSKILLVQSGMPKCFDWRNCPLDCCRKLAGSSERPHGPACQHRAGWQ
jgi:hypothetical protein